MIFKNAAEGQEPSHLPQSRSNLHEKEFEVQLQILLYCFAFTLITA